MSRFSGLIVDGTQGLENGSNSKMGRYWLPATQLQTWNPQVFCVLLKLDVSGLIRKKGSYPQHLVEAIFIRIGHGKHTEYILFLFKDVKEWQRKQDRLKPRLNQLSRCLSNARYWRESVW